MLTLTSSKAAKAASKSNTRTKAKTITVEEDNPSQLWTEKYRPKSLADLPVHHSKVRAFKDWLEKALEVHECYFDLGGSGQTCFLAIVGNAGCGKSSTVQQVCAEQNVSIIEWSDDLWDPESAGNRADWTDTTTTSSTSSGGSGSVYGNYSHRYEAEYGGGYSSAAQNLFKVEGVTWAAHTTKSDTLDAFALQSSYPSLSLLTKHCTNSTSAVSSSSSGKGGSSGSKLARTQSLTNNTNTTTTSTTANNTTPNTTAFQRKILLLKDPPSYDAHTNLKHSALYNFLLAVQCPVVMVLSDVSGRDDYSYAVDRCLPQAVKHRLQFESVYFTPVTAAKVAKVLDNILKSERVERSSRQVTSIIQDISTSCMGDIRQAVVQLQLLLGNSHHLHHTKNITNTTKAIGTTDSAAPGKLKRSQSLPNPHYNNNNSGTNDISVINSESTIYDKIPINSSSTNKKQKVEIVDLISPPTSPTTNTNTTSTTTTYNTAGTAYVSPAPSSRRSKRVVYDSDSDDCSTHMGANSSIIRGVSDGVLTNNTTSTVYNTTTATNTTNIANTVNNTNPDIVSAMSRRDTSYSSLHSVSKLLNATLDNQGMLKFDPDSVIERSELSAELILAFTQWNWIASVQATPRMHHHHYNTASTGPQELQPLSEGEAALLELKELEMALDMYSEIDLYTTRKYDTNSTIDRSGASAYPDGYIHAILSRASCASRGKGAAERKELAKVKGHKGSFQGIYRPKVLDVRSRTGAVQSKLRAIQNELMHLPLYTNTTPMYGADGGASGRYGGGGSMHHNNRNGYNSQTQYNPYYNTGVLSGGSSDSDVANSASTALIVPLRELLLHTIPYHTAMAQTIHNTHPTHHSQHNHTLHTLPLYTDKVDWMMGNLYNNSQTYSSTDRSGSAGGSTGSSVLLTNSQSNGPVDDIISEFD